MADPLNSLRNFTPRLNEVAEHVGKDAAAALAKAFGGTRIFVPKAPVDGHKIARTIGLEAMGTLCRVYGPANLEIPICAVANRWDAILSTPGSAAKVARKVGCHIRTVYRVRAAARAAR
jgi:hypothetical protein